MPRKEAYAAIALTEAVKVGIDASSNDPASIVATAELFYNFLAGEDAVAAPGTPPATAPATKPAATKPAATKPATTPATTKPAATKPAATKPAVDPAFEAVKGLVKQLIEANLRAEAMQLLADNGANSTTSLVALGPEVVEAFTNAANELLATA